LSGEYRVSAKEGAKLFKNAKGGEFQAFAKLLTWLERSKVSEVLALKPLIQPERAAFRLGITGPPGAGKSTIVGRLIGLLRERGLKVGVIAVDPSSPFSHGAILGDRIRYSEHALDHGVFIRSLGTRGSLGGLSSAAFLMARAFDACGFDILLVETVGVGQTELDILHVADQVCVVLVPESGDSIQAMKAGLMEIADIFVVNKADRPGADGLKREIEASIHDGENAKSVQVLKTVASEGAGISELMAAILKLNDVKTALANRSKPERLREEAKALLRREWEIKVNARLKKIKRPSDLKKVIV
jgi:LAO/AO transport system kinase